jgi:hypothetical protein
VRPVSLAIRFSTLLRMVLPLDVDIARRHPLAAPAGSSLAEAVVAAAATSTASLAARSPTLNQHARTPSEIEEEEQVLSARGDRTGARTCNGATARLLGEGSGGPT